VLTPGVVVDAVGLAEDYPVRARLAQYRERSGTVGAKRMSEHSLLPPRPSHTKDQQPDPQ
jgi:hypothetical protein